MSIFQHDGFQANAFQIGAIQSGGAGDVTVTPGVGSLTLTGFAATLTASSSTAPGLVALTLTGRAATVAASATASPGLGSLTLTGFAATLAANASASVGVGSLTLTGFAPDVSATNGAVDVTVTPDAAVLSLTGYAPDVSAVDAPQEAQSRSQGGGPDPHYYKKRKKKQPEPVSKGFGDDWQPPVQRPAPPATLPLPAREIIARQEAGFAKTQAAIAQALELMARQQAEADALAHELAEQEDEDEAILLLMAA